MPPPTHPPSLSVVRSVSSAAAACGRPSCSSSDCTAPSSSCTRCGLVRLVGGGFSASAAGWGVGGWGVLHGEMLGNGLEGEWLVGARCCCWMVASRSALNPGGRGECGHRQAKQDPFQCDGGGNALRDMQAALRPQQQQQCASRYTSFKQPRPGRRTVAHARGHSRPNTAPSKLPAKTDCMHCLCGFNLQPALPRRGARHRPSPTQQTSTPTLKHFKTD